MRFRDLRKLLGEHGIVWDESRGKGSHGAFVGLSVATKTKKVYPIPKAQQKDTSRAYINPLRRTFELSRENGFPDDLFS